MKRVLCVVTMVLGMLAFAEDEPYQMLWWQLTDDSTQHYKDTAFAGLFAMIDDTRIGGESGIILAQSRETQEVLVGKDAEGTDAKEYGWDWTGVDITQATFYLELWNEEGTLLATSDGVHYGDLKDTYMTINGYGSERTYTATMPYSGWTFAIPEPTSGVLFLIGVAGLALKRKRLS